MNLNDSSILILLVAFITILVLVITAVLIAQRTLMSSSKLIIDIEDDLQYSIENSNEFIVLRCKLSNTGKELIKIKNAVAFLDNLQSATKDYYPSLYKISTDDNNSIANLKPNETLFANITFKIDNKNIPKIVNEFKYETFLKTFYYENTVYKGEPIQDTMVFTELNTVKNKYMYKLFENMSLTKGDYIFSLKLNYETDSIYESNLDKLSFAFSTNNMHELLVDRFLRRSILEIINYPITLDTKVIPISPDSIEKL